MSDYPTTDGETTEINGHIIEYRDRDGEIPRYKCTECSQWTPTEGGFEDTPCEHPAVAEARATVDEVLDEQND